MSRAEAEARIRRKTASLLNVRAEALRSEIYGTLERSQVGRGRVYGVTYRGRARDERGRYLKGGAQTVTRLHQASAPGDPPARVSGRLMESVKVLSRAAPDRLVARIGPDPKAFTKVPYPAYLEYGTRKMAPRPYMRPALESFRAAIRGGRR